MPGLGGLVKDRESYSALRKKFGADEEEEYEALTDLRTVNQQRARGESTRFEDKFQYMVDGLGPSEPLGVRRSSANEVLRKMLDTDFTRRLKSSGFIERVYAEFRRAGAGEGDRVLDPALAYLIATVGRDQRVAEALLLITPSQFDKSAEDDPLEPKSDLIARLSEMLARPWAGEPVGAAGAKGLSKPETMAMRSLRETIDKSHLIEPGSFEVNLRSLVLVAVSVIASCEPRTNFKPQERLVTGGALDAVCGAFVQETRTLELRITRYSTGLDLLPPDGSVSITLIDTCLRLLDAMGSSCAEASAALEHHRELIAPGLVNVLLVSYLLTRDPVEDKLKQNAIECLLSTLGRLIHLTLDPDWCVSLAKDPKLVSTLVRLVRAARSTAAREGRGRFDLPPRDAPAARGAKPEDDPMSDGAAVASEEGGPAAGKHNSDVLCLVVGTLANLAELAEDVKHALRTTFLDRDCMEEPRCVRECQCPNRHSAIHVLLDLHADNLDDIDDVRPAAAPAGPAVRDAKDVDMNVEDENASSIKVTRTFVNGYAAMLLGLVMVDASENQEIIATALEDDPRALAAIIGALEGFASLPEQEDSQSQSQTQTQTQEQAEETDGGLAARVRGTIAQLRNR